MTQGSGHGGGEQPPHGTPASSGWLPPPPQYPPPGPWGQPGGYRVPPPPPPRGWGAGRIVLVTLAGMLVLAGILVALVVVLVPLAEQAPQDAQRDARGRVTEASRIDKDALRPGDCVNDEALRELGLGEDMQTMTSTVDVVPCTRRHDFEVTAAFTLPDRDYSGAGELRKAVNRGCVRRLRQEWSADRRLLRDKILAFYLPPPRATQDDHTVCMLQLASGEQMRGSIR